jgi:uncharacterized membrane protein YsdA (DUF1294 family)
MLPQTLMNYLFAINVISFLLMGLDKGKAVFGKYRISEKGLLIPGVLGGAVGLVLGMLVFRHKVKKTKFIIPAVLVFLLNVVYWYLIYLYIW